MVCGPTEWQVSTFIEHLKLITSLLTANVNYCHSRKLLHSFFLIPFSDVTTLALKLVSELSYYTGPTSLVNSQ